MTFPFLISWFICDLNCWDRNIMKVHILSIRWLKPSQNPLTNTWSFFGTTVTTVTTPQSLQEIARMETDFAKVSGDASGLAADMVRLRSERAEARQGAARGRELSMVISMVISGFAWFSLWLYISKLILVLYGFMWFYLMFFDFMVIIFWTHGDFHTNLWWLM